ncbi:hypothetical protein L1987_42121 [Smallanthus sonchifolius]|uniref:Uncharacterized protein n=1 Tax=Smallanthus sonchifolius TaxID=185202 RepID=A0ACB9GVM8_9ASTR|nr:hypothetical protein L1987_42121 [Smallanthus sonchifolius]
MCRCDVCRGDNKPVELQVRMSRSFTLVSFTHYTPPRKETNTGLEREREREREREEIKAYINLFSGLCNGVFTFFDSSETERDYNL